MNTPRPTAVASRPDALPPSASEVVHEPKRIWPVIVGPLMSWNSDALHKSGARRPDGKARRPSIPGVCEGGATPPAGMPRPEYVENHVSEHYECRTCGSGCGSRWASAAPSVTLPAATSPHPVTALTSPSIFVESAEVTGDTRLAMSSCAPGAAARGNETARVLPRAARSLVPRQSSHPDRTVRLPPALRPARSSRREPQPARSARRESDR